MKCDYCWAEFQARKHPHRNRCKTCQRACCAHHMTTTGVCLQHSPPGGTQTLAERAVVAVENAAAGDLWAPPPVSTWPYPDPNRARTWRPK